MNPTTKKKMIECELCDGKGAVILSCCTGDRLTGLYEDYELCPVCKEHVVEDTCPECDGFGYNYETEGLPDSKKQESVI